MKKIVLFMISVMMMMSLTACGDSKPEETLDTALLESVMEELEVDEEEDVEETEESEEMKETEDSAESAEEKNGVTPEFKEAMDAYEEFFDEYVEFMEEYEDSDFSASMLPDYLEFLATYEKTMKELDDIDQEELSDADLAYYIEVTTRIEMKLLEVAK